MPVSRVGELPAFLYRRDILSVLPSVRETVSLPNPSSLAADSPVRAGFHAALEQIESYPVERNWRPAFLTPLSTLPHPRRMPLADLPGKRPAITPFGGQSLTLAGALQALPRAHSP